MTNEPTSDETIIARVKQDDEKAYNMLYQIYHRRAFDLALVIVKDEDWALDVVQETFMKVWTSKHKLREDNDIWYYIRAIVKNECINKLREIQKDQKLKQKLAHAVSERLSTFYDPLIEKALLQRYEVAKQKLTAQQLIVFTMCREEGLTYKEVAERLNISKNTVKNHMIASIRILKMFHKKDILYFLLFFLKS